MANGVPACGRTDNYTVQLGLEHKHNPALFDAINACKTANAVIDVLKTPQFLGCVPEMVARFQAIPSPGTVNERICGLIPFSEIEKCRSITTLFRNRHLFADTIDEEHMAVTIGSEPMYFNRLLLMSEIPYFAGLFSGGIRRIPKQWRYIGPLGHHRRNISSCSGLCQSR